MPRLTVFACPSCGASLGVEEGAASAKCQFCGSTVIVPAELRGNTPRAETPPVPVLSGSLSGMPDMGKMKQMGDAVRAGNKIEAIKIYREIFGVSLLDAKNAVELMAAGQPVTINTMGATKTSVVQMNASALGSPFATSGSPVIVNTQPFRRGGCLATSIGLIIALVGVGIALAAVFYTTMPDLAQTITGAVANVTNQYPRVVLTFGGEGTGPGLFTDPRSIAVAPDGSIYVAEYTGGQIKQFDATGKFVKQFKIGAQSTSLIQALAVDRSGKLFVVVDSLLRRVDAQSGEDLGEVEYAGGWGFDDVAAAPDGGLVASWYKGDDNLVLFDNDLRPANTIENAISGLTGDPELDTQVAVAGNGDIFALGAFNNAVFHYSSTGDSLNSFGSAGDEAGQLRAPGDMAVDAQGNVYVSDFKGIQVFAPDGRYLSLITGPSYAYIQGLAFDEAGALYAVANTKKIYKFQLTAPAQ